MKRSTNLGTQEAANFQNKRSINLGTQEAADFRIVNTRGCIQGYE